MAINTSKVWRNALHGNSDQETVTLTSSTATAIVP
jgi:hypothetical protein